MKFDQDQLVDPIMKIFKNNNIRSHIEPIKEQAVSYLKRSYLEIESYWETAFNNTNTVKYVLIGEAPIYGKARAYFYNPDSRHTSFLRPSNVKIMNIDSISADSTRNTMPKQDFLGCLAKSGFMIVDIFPYALNNIDTRIAFSKFDESPVLSGKHYASLFEDISENYFFPKLDDLIGKSSRKLKVLYRYKRVHDRVGGKINSYIIKKAAIMNVVVDISVLGGMNIGRDAISFY